MSAEPNCKCEQCTCGDSCQCGKASKTVPAGCKCEDCKCENCQCGTDASCCGPSSSAGCCDSSQGKCSCGDNCKCGQPGGQNCGCTNTAGCCGDGCKCGDGCQCGDNCKCDDSAQQGCGCSNAAEASCSCGDNCKCGQPGEQNCGCSKAAQPKSSCCSKTTTTPINITNWITANQQNFLPPVCNKLMFGHGQLKVMYVGGPNVRKDFHIEEGEELFYQVKGDAAVVIMERGKPRRVPIREGEVWLLPSHIPHSPQRYENTVGLVIERARLDTEVDGLRYYCDDDTTVLWEEWFHCEDLGAQLVPVIKTFFASQQHATGKPIPGDHIAEVPPVEINTTLEVPPPFSLDKWLEDHAADLATGPQHVINGRELKMLADTGAKPPSEHASQTGQIWLWQYRGSSTLAVQGQTVQLQAQDCYLIECCTPFTWTQADPATSVGFSIEMIPPPKKSCCC